MNTPHAAPAPPAQSQRTQPPARFVSPSELDGVGLAAEETALGHAADLMRSCAGSLRLSNATCVAAQLLLQRFYTQVSLHAHSTVWAAGACLLLAAKLCNEARSLRDVCSVVHDRLCAREGRGCRVEWEGLPRRRPLAFFAADGYDWKFGVLEAERHVLKVVGFRVGAETAHGYVLMFLNTLREKAGAGGWQTDGVVRWRRLLQKAWGLANGCMRGRVCVEVDVAVLACACVGVASVECGEGMVVGWERAFGCEIEECERVRKEVRRVVRIGDTRGMFVDYCEVEALRFLREEERCSGKRKRSRFEDG